MFFIFPVSSYFKRTGIKNILQEINTLSKSIPIWDTTTNHNRQRITFRRILLHLFTCIVKKHDDFPLNYKKITLSLRNKLNSTQTSSLIGSVGTVMGRQLCVVLEALPADLAPNCHGAAMSFRPGIMTSLRGIPTNWLKITSARVRFQLPN